jgi:hypothetical protein
VDDTRSESTKYLYKSNFFAGKFGGLKYNAYFCRKFSLNDTLMHKKILILSSLALFMMAAPIQATPMAMEMEMGVAEQIEAERSIIISVEGNSVNVQGASGMVLEVVSITGRHVTSVKIEGPSQRVDLNIPRGCYILKVGKVVRKVTIR